MSGNSLNYSRRAFLSGKFNQSSASSSNLKPLRPPWAVTESQFIDLCCQCNDCLKSCPENILISASGGYPEVDFSKGACTFCQECLSACHYKALSEQDSNIPWSLTAELNDKCLPMTGIACQTCQDECEARAILFSHDTRGILTPTIDADLCTGCGACFSICPAQAITLS